MRKCTRDGQGIRGIVGSLVRMQFLSTHVGIKLFCRFICRFRNTGRGVARRVESPNLDQLRNHREPAFDRSDWRGCRRRFRCVRRKSTLRLLSCPDLLRTGSRDVVAKLLQFRLVTLSLPLVGESKPGSSCRRALRRIHSPTACRATLWIGASRPFSSAPEGDTTKMRPTPLAGALEGPRSCRCS